MIQIFTIKIIINLIRYLLVKFILKVVLMKTIIQSQEKTSQIYFKKTRRNLFKNKV